LTAENVLLNTLREGGRRKVVRVASGKEDLHGENPLNLYAKFSIISASKGGKEREL
jgi:hypothetical protein